MECRECFELLPLYVDHNLSASEVTEIKHHLETCRTCSREFSKLEETVTLVCNLSCVEPPDDFHRRFMARFNQECKPTHGWTLWGSMALSTAAAAAMVLLVVVLYNPLPPLSVPQQEAASLPAQSAEAPPPAPADQSRPAPEKKLAAASTESSKDKIAPNLPAAAESESAAAGARPMARRASGLNSLITAVDFTPGSSKAESKPMRSESARDDSAAAEPLVRSSGEWSGESCQVREPRQQVLRSPQALQEFWRSSGLQSLAVPEVDWQREMIGAIFLGEKPTRGYEIQLRELQRPADALVVKFAVQTPQGPATTQLTQPFLIFRLPATKAPVRFIQE
jgi:hypothetical protein